MKPTYPPGVVNLIPEADLPSDPRSLPFTTVSPEEELPPPGPDSNVIRVFRWPAGVGQWFCRVGDGQDKSSIQYGPGNDPAALLERFAAYLSRRGHQFDQFWEPSP
jgi:hypothetical protein